MEPSKALRQTVSGHDRKKHPTAVGRQPIRGFRECQTSLSDGKYLIIISFEPNTCRKKQWADCERAPRV